MEVLSSQDFTMSPIDAKVELDSMRKSNSKTTSEFIQEQVQKDIKKIEESKVDQTKIIELTGQGGLLNKTV